MLMSGFIQPIPDLSPVIPSVDEIPSVDPEVSPYEINITEYILLQDLGYLGLWGYLKLFSLS
jgi:diaminohydroxyphosphoribosylaminopyrimidine deaminase/5-amino-6-(5-phosphoribosylamino)uracil reductase